jgi:hypothetical protein
MPCLHIVVHLCLAMSMHLYCMTLVYHMHEWYRYDRLCDVEMLLRPRKRYRWCKLTPEGYRGDGLG